jgi:hypothetical protein
MVVIRHYTPRMNPPTGLGAHLGEAFEEGLFCADFGEDVGPVVATVKHVVVATGRFDS